MKTKKKTKKEENGRKNEEVEDVNTDEKFSSWAEETEVAEVEIKGRNLG